MGIISVDQIVLRHLFFDNSIFKFIIRDNLTLGSPCILATLWLTIQYWRQTIQTFKGFNIVFNQYKQS